MRSVWEFCLTEDDKEQTGPLMPFADKQGHRSAAKREANAAGRTVSAYDLNVQLFYKAIDLSG